MSLLANLQILDLCPWEFKVCAFDEIQLYLMLWIARVVVVFSWVAYKDTDPLFFYYLYFFC